MGIPKKLIEMWKTRREDVLTTLNVLKELGHATDEGVAYTIATLDRFTKADGEAKTGSA